MSRHQRIITDSNAAAGVISTAAPGSTAAGSYEPLAAVSLLSAATPTRSAHVQPADATAVDGGGGAAAVLPGL